MVASGGPVNVKREDVVAALRAEDVANHYGIKGPWRGRWMRSRRCARTDHSSDAFGLARDGMWHCWACDEGGDLLKLIAAGEGLDVRADFPRVLELAAAMAGIETGDDDFGGPVVVAKRERPAPPPVEPIATRLALAKKRGAWVWHRLKDRASDVAQSRGGRLLSDGYLEGVRRIPIDAIRTREDYRDTPLILSGAERGKGGDLDRMAKLFSAPGLALAVRSPIDGAIVDIRVRRFDDKEGRSKIVGMLGGVTSAPAEDGRGRELLGCYGFPHDLEKESIVVVEGMVDYLTALAAFPDHDVLGAVEAGTLSLVAKIAAQALARRNDHGRLLLVEHADGMRIDKQGKEKPGAGDVAMNEEPNAATKVAIRVLGPRRVGWLFCGGGDGIKDLNDMWRAGIPYAPRWWSELGDEIDDALKVTA